MIKLSLAATLAFAALATAGCATTDTPDTNTSKAPRALPHELEATTGSNMRRRTPLETSGGDVQKVTREQLESDAARSGSAPPR